MVANNWKPPPARHTPTSFSLCPLKEVWPSNATALGPSSNTSSFICKPGQGNNEDSCCSRPKPTAANILLYGCQDIAFSPYGEYWRQVRKLCVVELLSLKRVQQFQFAREEEVEELVKKIRKACLSKSPINLSDMLSITFNNILSRCVIGNRFVEEDDNWFGEASRRLMVQLTTFSFGDIFPCLRWIDNLRGFIASLKATSAKLDGFFDQLIEEHKTTKAEGMPKTSDFVDILVKLGKDDMLNLELTQDNLKAILQDMFIGGSDTTSTALEWLMAELVRNPSVMKKLQQETTSSSSSFTSARNNRRCNTGTLGGYYIPAKTRVLVNAFAIQRDPKFWDKPEEFLPDRFEDNSIDFKGQDFQFVPFGGGRRGCPGQAFAVAGAEYVVANLLYWFDWKLPSDNVSADALDMSEVFGMTVRKKAPLHLVPIPYSP
ncbi:hypothetical protein ABKV19_012120 [Rosa sericea]